MQPDPAVRRQRVLDGHPRDLVAKADRVALGPQHPGRQARVERRQIALRQRLQQPQLRAPRNDGDDVQQGERAFVQARDPGQHRVAHRGRNGVIGGREHLGDVERVAGRPAIQLAVVDARRSRERGDRVRGERSQRHPLRGVTGELAEHDPQRVSAVELVVAVGRQHQRRDRLDAASEQAHDVQRGLVGPVQVLQHHDARRPAAQLRRQRRDEHGGRGALRDDRAELAAGLLGHVGERPERTRRVQRVTGAPQQPDRSTPRAERPHERRLADPGLTADEHQPPATVRTHGGEVLVEGVELRGALEQPALAGVQRRRQAVRPNPAASQPATR